MKRQSSQIRPTRRRRTPQEKAEILRAHRRSGLSLLAFAGKHGLCYTSLLRWSTLRPEGDQVLVSAGTGADPGFVPVKIEGAGFGVDYVLNWPGGRSLKIPVQFETDSLRRLLEVLEGAR